MNTPTTKGVSRTFGFFILAFVTLGVLAILWAMGHYHQPPVTTTPMRADSGTAGEWWNKYKPSAVPTPEAYRVSTSPYHMPASPPIMIPQPPAQAYQAPKAAPTPNEEAQRRQREYLSALSSSIVPKSDNGQVQEIASVKTPVNSAITPITVSAQPAPPHTISAWSWVYATLETGIDSDHPGDVIGHVSGFCAVCSPTRLWLVR